MPNNSTATGDAMEMGKRKFLHGIQLYNYKTHDASLEIRGLKLTRDQL